MFIEAILSQKKNVQVEQADFDIPQSYDFLEYTVPVETDDYDILLAWYTGESNSSSHQLSLMYIPSVIGMEYTFKGMYSDANFSRVTAAAGKSKIIQPAKAGTWRYIAIKFNS